VRWWWPAAKLVLFLMLYFSVIAAGSIWLQRLLGLDG